MNPVNGVGAKPSTLQQTKRTNQKTIDLSNNCIKKNTSDKKKIKTFLQEHEAYQHNEMKEMIVRLSDTNLNVMPSSLDGLLDELVTVISKVRYEKNLMEPEEKLIYEFNQVLAKCTTKEQVGKALDLTYTSFKDAKLKGQRGQTRKDSKATFIEKLLKYNNINNQGIITNIQTNNVSKQKLFITDILFKQQQQLKETNLPTTSFSPGFPIEDYEEASVRTDKPRDTETSDYEYADRLQFEQVYAAFNVEDLYEGENYELASSTTDLNSYDIKATTTTDNPRDKATITRELIKCTADLAALEGELDVACKKLDVNDPAYAALLNDAEVNSEPLYTKKDALDKELAELNSAQHTLTSSSLSSSAFNKANASKTVRKSPSNSSISSSADRDAQNGSATVTRDSINANKATSSSSHATTAPLSRSSSSGTISGTVSNGSGTAISPEEDDTTEALYLATLNDQSYSTLDTMIKDMENAVTHINNVILKNLDIALKTAIKENNPRVDNKGETEINRLDVTIARIGKTKETYMSKSKLIHKIMREKKDKATGETPPFILTSFRKTGRVTFEDV